MKFLDPKEAEKFKNKSGKCFVGHPVCSRYYVLGTIFQVLCSRNYVLGTMIQVLCSRYYVQVTMLQVLCYRSYRVSKKNRPTLVLQISQLSRGLEIPFWTFFNSPFHVEFKNVYIFIIWCYLDRNIAKILGCGHFDT